MEDPHCGSFFVLNQASGKATIFAMPMRSSLMFLSGLGATAIVFILATGQKPAKTQAAQGIYQARCAGCHGRRLESFTGRVYKFGSTPLDLARAIQKGLPELGMPAYEKALSPLEISQLAEYLLQPSQARKIQEEGPASGKTITSEVQRFRVETIVKGLDCPWGMAFLPNGELLITERSGQLLRLINGSLSSPVEGVPAVFAKGQGGLLDIRLHPDYKRNGWIYFSYAYQSDGTGNTAVMRAKLQGNRLIGQEILFKAEPPSASGVHFGSRLDFDRQGFLYITAGERGKKENAQDLSHPGGKVHRILDDGRLPPDNPFLKQAGVIPSIFTYGHRNPQGMRVNPWTGELWIHEHGPKGGDEINILRSGANYGWPKITHGIDYDGTIISQDKEKAGMESPLHHWIPSIAPCGMAFLDSDRYPAWKGNLFVGALSQTHLRRCQLSGRRVVHEENLLSGLGRVRNVEVGPDGLLYVALERPGKILRLQPL